MMTMFTLSLIACLTGVPKWSSEVVAGNSAAVAPAAAVDPVREEAAKPEPAARPERVRPVRPRVRPAAVVPPAAVPETGPEAAKTDAGAGAAADASAPAVDAVAAPAGPTAAEIVARVQAVYDGTASFQANFRQVFRHRLNPERSKTASGVVYLQKPGKMRWEYHEPDRKLIVSDGSTLWAYEPSDQQVFEQSLEDTDLPTAVSFLLGSGSLSAEFDPRLLESGSEVGDDRWVLELRPRTASSHYARLVLVVSRTDYQVIRTVVVDHSGNTNSIEFAGVQLGNTLADDLFRFVRPEGVRVIR